MSEINLVYYLVSRKVEGKKTERACAGAFGYSYDVSVVGKKKVTERCPDYRRVLCRKYDEQWNCSRTYRFPFCGCF